MKLKSFAILFCFLTFNKCSTQPLSRNIQIHQANTFISEYIHECSLTNDYSKFMESFNCFYKNAVLTKRKNYTAMIDSLNEKFYGIDSLIIFNQNYDTALCYFIFKVSNYEKNGFLYISRYLFGFKQNNQDWRFYDGCQSRVYLEDKYSLNMVTNNERLLLAIDYKWLLGWGDDKLRTNPAFITKSSDVFCGICDEWEMQNNKIFCEDLLREQTPPDSLYNCK